VHRFEKHELKPESAHTHRYNLHYVTLLQSILGMHQCLVIWRICVD